jgi:hypothetical protein
MPPGGHADYGRQRYRQPSACQCPELFLQSNFSADLRRDV